MAGADIDQEVDDVAHAPVGDVVEETLLIHLVGLRAEIWFPVIKKKEIVTPWDIKNVELIAEPVKEIELPGIADKGDKEEILLGVAFADVIHLLIDAVASFRSIHIIWFFVSRFSRLSRPSRFFYIVDSLMIVLW